MSQPPSAAALRAAELIQANARIHGDFINDAAEIIDREYAYAQEAGSIIITNAQFWCRIHGGGDVPCPCCAAPRWLDWRRPNERA